MKMCVFFSFFLGVGVGVGGVRGVHAGWFQLIRSCPVQYLSLKSSCCLRSYGLKQIKTAKVLWLGSEFFVCHIWLQRD